MSAWTQLTDLEGELLANQGTMSAGVPLRHAIISNGSARILLHNKRKLTALVLCICVDKIVHGDRPQCCHHVTFKIHSMQLNSSTYCTVSRFLDHSVFAILFTTAVNRVGCRTTAPWQSFGPNRHLANPPTFQRIDRTALARLCPPPSHPRDHDWCSGGVPPQCPPPVS